MEIRYHYSCLRSGLAFGVSEGQLRVSSSKMEISSLVDWGGVLFRQELEPGPGTLMMMVVVAMKTISASDYCRGSYLNNNYLVFNLGKAGDLCVFKIKNVGMYVSLSLSLPNKRGFENCRNDSNCIMIVIYRYFFQERKNNNNNSSCSGVFKIEKKKK